MQLYTAPQDIPETIGQLNMVKLEDIYLQLVKGCFDENGNRIKSYTLPIIFLAGGITNCSEWQDEVIKQLELINTNFIVCNPRRKNFPIDDSNAAQEQIEWEFNALEKCSIFTMYFDDSISDQPICFYELGRNIERMKQKFPADYKDRIIITCNPNFKRQQDVIIQTHLALGEDFPIYNTLDEHIQRIKNIL
jgi:hypothetical protein